MPSSIRKLARHEAARVSKLIYLTTDLITALVIPIFPLNLKFFSAIFFLENIFSGAFICDHTKIIKF